MKRRHMENRIDLDALEAALAKSTPGEWYAERNSRFAYLRVGRHGIGDFCGSLFVAGGDNDTQLSFDNANAAALAHNALPALIAELRELRARVTPEVIREKHKDGSRWLVWSPTNKQWYKALWRKGRWEMTGRLGLLDRATHALPLPPALEVRRGEEVLDA
jgi:hypothetical protein